MSDGADHRHPGDFIRRDLLPVYRLKIANLARMLGVNRSNLSNVLHGRAELSRDLIYRLGALLGDDVADDLIERQHRWSLAQERERRSLLKREIAPLGTQDS